MILKGVDASGWRFAGHAFSPKGGHLAHHPRAALTFYWPEHGRQIRIRGSVTPGAAEENTADFLDRSPTARAASPVDHPALARYRPPALVRRTRPVRPAGGGCGPLTRGR
ncbi:pyridoxamine 5'-phosphate oxidase family protein [Streptomyces vinaceus]|uniref:pyridoxamine 5'-phosphate oxidase family protein n=1 Tax=Streptomyces vinaceus TaxID=1960 RepID=UPI0036AD523F